MIRWAALIAALLAASPVEAQCLGFQCPPGVLGGGTSGMPLPLDSFTTPSGAYSFRKLKSTYSGPAIRIRRASDNLETDINFLGFVPGLGAPWDEAAANAHCAATTCFIRTWYDQSGLGRHLNQTTAANQPALIFNCQGTLPCARLIAPQAIAAASVTPATGLVSLSAVANRRTGTANCLFIEQNGFGNRITGQNTVANSWILAGSTAASMVLADAAWHAVQGVINGASSAINADGVDATVSVTGTVTAGAPTIGAAGASTCDVAEAAVWDNYGLTLAERSALAENQKNYWAPYTLDAFASPAGAYSMRRLKSSYSGPAIRIRRASDNAETDINFLGYVPGLGSPIDMAAANAHCAATTCFVRTWYDQSGNARNLNQATAGSQLTLVLDCLNGLACVQATAGMSALSTNITPATGVASLSWVANRISGTGACQVDMNGNVSGNRLNFSSPTLIQASAASGNVNSGVVNNGTWNAVQGIFNSASSSITVNGAATSGTLTNGTVAGFIGVLGSGATVCNQAEFVVWDNYILTAGEIAALTDNQKNYWMPLPLDSFTTPSGAYSFRKLKSTYSGPAIRIRRASDNAETDIGFLGFVPGLGSPIDVAAANAHCAATSCFIRTWYDQSGGTLDIVNATPATQPALQFSCQNGLPCLRSTISDNLQSAGNFTGTAAVTLNAVTTRGAGTGNCFYRVNGPASNRFNRRVGTPGFEVLGSVGTIVNTSSDAVWHSATAVINGASSSLNVDGGVTSGSVTSSTATGVVGYFGAAATTCDWGEVVFWGSALSAAEVTALTANQRSFWGF